MDSSGGPKVVGRARKFGVLAANCDIDVERGLFHAKRPRTVHSKVYKQHSLSSGETTRRKSHERPELTSNRPSSSSGGTLDAIWGSHSKARRVKSIIPPKSSQATSKYPAKPVPLSFSSSLKPSSASPPDPTKHIDPSDIADPSLRPGTNPFAHLGIGDRFSAGAWWTLERHTPAPWLHEEDALGRAKGAGVSCAGKRQSRLMFGQRAESGPCAICGYWVDIGADVSARRAHAAVCGRARRPVRCGGESVEGVERLGDFRRDGHLYRVLRLGGSVQKEGWRTSIQTVLDRANDELGRGLRLPNSWTSISERPPIVEELVHPSGAHDTALVTVNVGEQTIASIAILEPIRHAYKLVPGPIPSVEPTPIPLPPTSQGISIMWTDPSYRGQGITRQALQLLQHNIRPASLAFSQPTTDGIRLATKLTHTPAFLVYDF